MISEERIKELADNIVRNLWKRETLEKAVKRLIRTVAAEAREEGIDEAVEIAWPCLIESENIKKAVALEIERLKEKGK